MIEIAEILKPQGIKGELKALPLTNVVEVFSSLKECLVGNRTMQIERSSFRQGFLYIKFKGLNNRNDAELERGKIIKIERHLLEQAKEEDEFFVDEDNKVGIDCNVVVTYGQNVVTAASAVQVAVYNAVDSMTGIKVSSVNVNICEIVRQ